MGNGARTSSSWKAIELYGAPKSIRVVPKNSASRRYPPGAPCVTQTRSGTRARPVAARARVRNMASANQSIASTTSGPQLPVAWRMVKLRPSSSTRSFSCAGSPMTALYSTTCFRDSRKLGPLVTR